MAQNYRRPGLDSNLASSLPMMHFSRGKFWQKNSPDFNGFNEWLKRAVTIRTKTQKMLSKKDLRLIEFIPTLFRYFGITFTSFKIWEHLGNW